MTIKSKTYLLISFVAIIFIGCQKDVDTKPYVTPIVSCENLYTTISTDTNYIPHKRNNYWVFCQIINNKYNDFSTTIISDTLINKTAYFVRRYNYGTNPHDQWQCNCFNNSVLIDSLGNYYSTTMDYPFADTIMIIKVNANDGDTIYKNNIKGINVILVNKNETIETLTGCYHTKLTYPNKVQEIIYKKGIGELYFQSGKLIRAKIN